MKQTQIVKRPVPNRPTTDVDTRTPRGAQLPW